MSESSLIKDDKKNVDTTLETSNNIKELKNKLNRLENQEKSDELEEEIDAFSLKVNTAIENGLFDIDDRKGPFISIINWLKYITGKKIEYNKNNGKEEYDQAVLNSTNSLDNDSLKKNKDNSNSLNFNKNNDSSELLLDLIVDSRQSLGENNLPNTENKLSRARREYTKQIDETPFWWKFSNIYAGYAWLYLLIILIITFSIFYSGLDLEEKLKVKDPAINATTWGVIGAVLRAMWFLKSKVDTRTYKNSYNVYFISIPFLGGILGAIVYLILLGGLFALQGNALTTDNGESDNNTTNNLVINPLTIIPFAALAGYNWEWAINLFNRIGDFLMEETKTKKQEKNSKGL